MSEEEKECKIGTVNFKDACWTKKALVKKLIADADFKLTPQASTYINALDDSEALYGLRGVDTQIAYIMSNLIPETKSQDLVMQQLDDIMKGQSVSTILKEQDPNMITEIEYERITMGFERWTEGKVDDLHRLRDRVEYGEIEETPEVRQKIEKLKLKMDDFVEYSKMRNIPVDKVLVAQGWVDDVLAEDVLKAKKEAEKRISVEFE